MEKHSFNKNACWDEFEGTGNIKSYLRYKGKLTEADPWEEYDKNNEYNDNQFPPEFPDLTEGVKPKFF